MVFAFVGRGDEIDTLPLLGGKDSGGILPIVAKAADVAENDILGSDLFLYCRGRGTVLGVHGEYILSPKLDDLACAWGCTQGFLASGDSGSLPVLCIFDNEEVGSATKQGAASTRPRWPAASSSPPTMPTPSTPITRSMRTPTTAPA